MRHTIGLPIAVLLAPIAFGQATPQAIEGRTFILQHAGTVQEFQEIATLIRTIAEIRDLTADNDQRSLAVHGTAEQVGLAGWLVKQLDQPVGGPGPGAAVLEYKVADGDVAQVFYLPHAPTIQDFQEAANAIRTVTEMRRVFTYNDGRVMAVRDTPERVAMAGWMANEMDQATNAQASKTTVREYSAAGNDALLLFSIANAKTVQDFQEIANAMRTTTEIRRVFTYNTPRIVAVRDTLDDLAMAAWLLKELDKPASASVPVSASTNSAQSDVPEYRVPGAADDVVRVYHLTNTASVEAFQKEANAVRSAAGIRRAFTYNAERALTLRGTVNQLALAENLMRDLAGPQQ